MRKYAGIGSRQTPVEILEDMRRLGRDLAENGWVLRSGGADGADSAFEAGCDLMKGSKEIFLPWMGFNGNESPLFNPSVNAAYIASTLHPAWDKLSYGAQKLHARNCHQILGEHLDDPVDIVICWTPGGEVVGGTATAIKLAEQHGIRVINLAIDTLTVEDLIRLEDEK